MNMPWKTEAEMAAAIEQEWENIKAHGEKVGLLKRNADGALVGHGDPNELFDSYEKAVGNQALITLKKPK